MRKASQPARDKQQRVNKCTNHPARTHRWGKYACGVFSTTMHLHSTEPNCWVGSFGALQLSPYPRMKEWVRRVRQALGAPLDRHAHTPNFLMIVVDKSTSEWHSFLSSFWLWPLIRGRRVVCDPLIIYSQAAARRTFFSDSKVKTLIKSCSTKRQQPKKSKRQPEWLLPSACRTSSTKAGRFKRHSGL